MKKIWKGIFGVLICGFLTGCGVTTTPEIIMPDQPMVSSVDTEQKVTTDSKMADSTQVTREKKKDTQQEYTIYLITMDLSDSYWKSIDNGCIDAATQLGNIRYKWTGPDTHDDAQQSACIDAAVADGANAILIATNSAEGINDSLRKAADAGCKIVYVDSAASYDCVTALSTDNVAAGRTAGETMKSALQEQGITSGTIGIMGVTVDTASCVAREQGFREAFEGTAFTLSDTVYMQDNTENVKNAVAEGISQEYIGFFGTNEGTTAAVGTALQEEGTQSIVIGFDTSDTVLEMVSDGIIYATMKQNPEVMGRDGLKIAVQALEGTYTDTNTKTDTGVTVITQDAM